jgi:hypothetical protein
MEGRRIRVKATTATTLALTGGYLLMEADYEGLGWGRRFKVFETSPQFVVHGFHQRPGIPCCRVGNA